MIGVAFIAGAFCGIVVMALLEMAKRNGRHLETQNEVLENLKVAFEQAVQYEREHGLELEGDDARRPGLIELIQCEAARRDSEDKT